MCRILRRAYIYIERRTLHVREQHVRCLTCHGLQYSHIYDMSCTVHGNTTHYIYIYLTLTTKEIFNQRSFTGHLVMRAMSDVVYIYIFLQWTMLLNLLVPTYSVPYSVYGKVCSCKQELVETFLCTNENISHALFSRFNNSLYIIDPSVTAYIIKRILFFCM